MRVLVCGGRDYGKALAERNKFNDVLDKINLNLGIHILIHGGASGADKLADFWAEINYIKCLRVPANWPKYGKSAGPIRNKEMLYFEPNLVVAFPGGRGTENMIKQATEANIEVINVSKVLDDTTINI